MADALAAALQKRKEKVSRSGKFPFSSSCLVCGCGIWIGTDGALQMMRTTMMIGDVAWSCIRLPLRNAWMGLWTKPETKKKGEWENRLCSQAF
jgi:hypothetical protein